MTQSGDRALINECKGECKLSLEIYSSCSWATCLLALPACVHELGCCPCRVGCRSAPPGLQTGARRAQLRLGRLSCVLGRVTDPAGPQPAGVPGAAPRSETLAWLAAPPGAAAVGCAAASERRRSPCCCSAPRLVLLAANAPAGQAQAASRLVLALHEPLL